MTLQPGDQKGQRRQELFHRGAAHLIEQAPSMAGALATGGWLGLLAACSLHSLLLPQTLALPAIMKLLEALGLNVMAGYLGDALKDVWRRTGRPEAQEATRAEIATVLRRIAEQHEDAAVEIAQAARASGALQRTLDAINAHVAGGEALWEGLRRDTLRSGAVLEALQVELRDVKQGVRAVFRVAEETRRDTTAIRADTAAMRPRIDAIYEQGLAGERQRREREQMLLDHYLLAIVNLYRDVQLSRFVELKKGTGERTLPQLFLEDIYTALTTNHPPLPLRLRTPVRPARVVRRAVRFFAGKAPDRAPPEQARLFDYQLPPEMGQRGQAHVKPGAEDWLAVALQIPAVEGWVSGDLPDGIAPDTPLQVRLRRPELVVEALAPRKDRAARQRRLVLLGDPGSGKSTVLRYVAVLLAQSLLGRRPCPPLRGWTEPRIPLLLPLGTVAELLREGGDDAAALRAALELVLEGKGAPRRGLAEGLPRLWARSVLLLDGLDELSAAPGPSGTPSPRHRVARAIRTLARELPDTPIVVTCRVLPYHTYDRRPDAERWQLPPDEGWQERLVQPFAFGQVRQFVTAWYTASAHDDGSTPADAAARANGLLDQLRANRALREAIALSGVPATNDPPASPLLLTMLTILHYNRDGRPLPPERDELYEKLVDLLLHRWEPRRGDPVYERDDLLKRLNITALGKTIEPLRRVLHQAAYEAHLAVREGGDGCGVLDAGTLRERFYTYFRDTLECDEDGADKKVRIFLAALRDEAGLLTRIGDDAYAFPHLTFQEYLAGCYLADREDPVKQAYDHWRGPDFDRWREPLLLMSGRLRQTNNAQRDGGRWLKRLTGARCPAPNGRSEDELQPKDDAQRQRDALLAADCYEVLGRRTRLDREYWEEVEDGLRTALLTILPLPEPGRPPAVHLSIAERQRAALALERLGDPRPGVCTPQPDWCEPIPAGEYLIGTQPDTFNENRMVTPHKVRLDKFRIARYPVTVWQFRRFWEDPQGYEHERWWPKRGWAWKQSKRRTKPYLWDAPDWTADNQPVIGISWYEVVAFCNWLTEHSRQAGWLQPGQVIRLPSEAEWEVAALWDERKKGMRPWNPPEGEIWQNVEEAGIGRPAPVGLFPQGASPCGALDMAGNVWEWCASAFDDYPRRSGKVYDDFQVRRLGPTLRGGGYYLQNISSGCGARFGGHPGGDFLVGFRVVVAPHLAL